MDIAMRNLPEIESIRLLTVNIPLGGKDASSTNVFKREPYSADSGEEINEFEATLCEAQSGLIKLGMQIGKS